ncbi:MAG: hypothetical protein E7F96_08525 [Veillonella sp.]|uniref:hypothetical protein n=1 Tax=Veillonella sp. TaxID=1926307 RepID=UPI00290CE30C|nr:hypothetical protein [Veillonella sp.]MDU3602325.1 hypothetical protein [Veillonella sp.]
MTEEKVTLKIINWLKNSKWIILSFDFPQSGTGHIFHPEESIKNKLSSFIPDIIAVKDTTAIFIENKNRYVLSDFYKQNELKNNIKRYNSVDEFLADYNIKNIYFGIGMPLNSYRQDKNSNSNLVDFILGVEENNLTVIFNQADIDF